MKRPIRGVRRSDGIDCRLQGRAGFSTVPAQIRGRVPCAVPSKAAGQGPQFPGKRRPRCQPRTPPIKTASRARPRRICCSTSTIRSSGGRGGRRRWRRRSGPTSRSCSRSATRRATGATSWRTRVSRTTTPPRVMNELFVNIKVDREERPDIDQIYMAALHHLGEHGGWPLTMFLTPAGEPIWGGTYFPKDLALRQAGLRRRAARDRAAVPRGAGEDRAEPRGADGAARRGGAAGGRRHHRRGRARQRGAPARRHHRSGQRRHARRAEISAGGVVRAAVARRAAHRRGALFRARSSITLAPHLRGRHLRPSRRRLLALFGRRALAGAAFREDALRQRAAPRAAGARASARRQGALPRSARRRPSTGSGAR